MAVLTFSEPSQSKAMNNLILNLYKYSLTKCVFLVLIGTFTFITSVASTVQDEKNVDSEGYSSEVVMIQLIGEEAENDFLHRINEFPIDSTPTVVGASKAGRKGHIKNTISFTPSGGLGWGSTSQVIP